MDRIKLISNDDEYKQAIAKLAELRSLLVAMVDSEFQDVLLPGEFVGTRDELAAMALHMEREIEIYAERTGLTTVA